MGSSKADNSQANSKLVEWVTVLIEILLLQMKLILHSIQALSQFFIPPEEKPVANEKVLITGTGHGIGKELARQYGELGATVVCVDINPDTNKETVSELRKLGIKAHGYECDVSNRENVLQLAKKVEAEVGCITILVNNAGIMPVKRFWDHTPEDIKRIFDINVFAHFWLIEAFVPSMKARNYGHIIGVSSIAGLLGLPNIVPYCASKFAVRGLMESAAEEYRKLGVNINFTTVYPYITDTGLCKNPRVKFPNAFPIQKPQNIAANIIKAQRSGYREVHIPYVMRPLHNIGRLFPEKAQMCVIDFLDSGVGAEEFAAFGISCYYHRLRDKWPQRCICELYFPRLESRLSKDSLREMEKISDEAVQATNDDASECKRYAVQMGYWRDPYIHLFATSVERKAPEISRGYYVRTKGVWVLIEKFIEASGGECQILNLGAGFDTLYWRLKDTGHKITNYVEVDFAIVTSRKCYYIKKYKTLLEKIHVEDGEIRLSATDLHSSGFHIVGADLRNLGELEAKLKDSDVRFDIPTFILTECVLVYMQSSSGDALLKFLSEKFKSAVFVNYEQVNIGDRFGEVMLKNLRARGCPLAGASACQSLKTQEDRFLHNDWDAVKSYDMMNVYQALPTEDRQRIEQLQLLDEQEILIQLFQHYCMVISYKGNTLRSVDFT